MSGADKDYIPIMGIISLSTPDMPKHGKTWENIVASNYIEYA
jgi:hypothetical protein